MIEIAQLKNPPKGEAVASAAKATKFLRAARVIAKLDGKSCSFTPATIAVHTPAALGAGVIIGRIETKIPGDETNLPAGSFDVFLANVDGEWHAYAESKAKIVAEAKHVEVAIDEHKGRPASVKPLFHPHGWCWSHTFHIRYNKLGATLYLDIKVKICF
ncbi:MAG TPA: hypothetical protein VFF06_34315 [Polyangia bacterium]|nr:hypothetical protein [Polyangia bacterium]